MDRAEYLSQLHAQFGVARGDVVNLVQRATGRAVAATHRLIRGDESEVHRVELTDGSAVYLRVAFPGTPPSKTLHEAWAMGRARDRGVPAPRVLATDTIHSPDGDRTAMVIAEAPGNPLLEVLSALRPEDRTRVMARIGRVLRVLHSVSMPGVGVPDDQDVWTDAGTHHRNYVAHRLAEAEYLACAGFTTTEIDQVLEALRQPPEAPDHPVLCHGDVSPHHVFIDHDLRIVGLIDWGMWHAGSAVSELAGIALTHTAADFDAILTGHDDGPIDPAFHALMAWHKVAQATHQIAWLVSSGQTAELTRTAAALQNVLGAEPDP